MTSNNIINYAIIKQANSQNKGREIKIDSNYIGVHQPYCAINGARWKISDIIDYVLEGKLHVLNISVLRTWKGFNDIYVRDKAEKINRILHKEVLYENYCKSKLYDKDKLSVLKEGLYKGVNTKYYDNPTYTLSHMKYLLLGLEEGYDIRLYNDTNFDDDQVRLLFTGLKKGIDISKYNNINYKSTMMAQIYVGLLNHVDITPYVKLGFTIVQLQLIREGLEKGLDVTKYARKGYSVTQMKEIMQNMEQKNGQSKTG